MPVKPNQFLDARPRGDAERLWHAVLRLGPLGEESVPLERALGRVLARDVAVPADVPPFDRSIVDGYALVAADTFGASEAAPARLDLLPERLLAGCAQAVEVGPGRAVEIATGAVLPRGANAVQMIERTDLEDGRLLVYRPVVPGQNVQAAGSDLRAGETALRRGVRLGSRETGVLAAMGVAEVACWRRPRVAVLSTGDELVPPGATLRPGLIFDANSRVVCDALVENGAEPVFLGIVPDDPVELRRALERAREHDAVVLSGGTSKGTGDLSFRLIDDLGKPGVVVHGVQLRPGKPLVLAAWDGRPVAVLPGFPTSAILTFNLFVRPVVRSLAGLPPELPAATVPARVPARIHSAPGRYEYVLVNLVAAADGGLSAWPVPRGSGSISAFAEADGYLEVPESRDMLLEGEVATVTLFSAGVKPADLVFIGSHCEGMDALFGLLAESHGRTVKVMNVGSSGGVAAVRRGEADLAGIHLLGSDGRYNREAQREAGPGAVLIRGYRRRQGIVYRPGDGAAPPSLADLALDPGRRLINRSRGAGTRVLLERSLERLAHELGRDAQELMRAIPGWDSDSRSHGAVALAVAQGRADWGLAIESAARRAGLGFVALVDEEYDLLVPRERLARPALVELLAALRSEPFAARLAALTGFVRDPRIGEPVLDPLEPGA